MNLQVIDPSNVVNFTRLRDEFTRTFERWSCTPKPKAVFPVLSQPNANTKLAKESDRTADYSIYSVFLAPADSSGHEMCLWRSNDCTDLCLNCSGKGAMQSVQAARIRKTQRLVEDPHGFFWSLLSEMQNACLKEENPVMRLNGTSDLPWDFIAPQLFSHFRLFNWKFYDYTKSVTRAYNQSSLWDNTLSFSGHNWAECAKGLADKYCRVAVVFDTPRGQPLPLHHRGYTVIDGDKDDLRFLDPKGVIVGLRYKVVTINGKRRSAADWGSPFIVTT